MKTMIFMRHGKSSWANTNQSDHERPLKPRGIHASALISRMLVKHQIKPDIILCSDAVRTQETCKILVATAHWQVPVQTLPSLYLAPPQRYYQQLTTLSDELSVVMMIGHNPAMEELVSELSGQPASFPTAATAVFKGEIEGWQHADDAQRWRLEHFWRPRDIED